MSGSHTVRQVAPGELRIELHGHFDSWSAAALEADVGRVLDSLEPRTFHVLIDLLGLRDCTMDARPAMVSLQRRLADRARRTAYYDDRPRFRGLALWVMHLAEDPNAKAVASLELARRWVAGTLPRSTRRFEASEDQVDDWT